MSRSPDNTPSPSVKRPVAAKIYTWLDERYHLESFLRFLRSKKVPTTGGSIWYYCGGVALFLFLVQVLTGLLMMMYYVPTTEQAFESLHYVMAKVRFGWFVRSMHAWSAHLMILLVIVHFFSVFFMRAYRRPRELTWMTGCVLIAVCLAFGFSGYLLPWNELSFFATKVGTDIVGELPWIGPLFLKIMRGGEDVTGATLSRFFGLHVAILPAVTTVVLALHLLMIQRQGMSEPQSWRNLPPQRRRSLPFFPHFFLHDLLLWFIVFNVLAALAVFWPLHMGVKADPFASAPAGIKPEWYFLAGYQALKWLPAKIGPLNGEIVGVLAMGLLTMLVFFLPFIDRTHEDGPRRGWLDVVGFIFLVTLVAMTVLGYVLE